MSAEQLQALFIRHLMDADQVSPFKPEALYSAKTQALVALANLAIKQKDQANQESLDDILDEEEQ